jgi:hypothetical protein
MAPYIRRLLFSSAAVVEYDAVAGFMLTEPHGDFIHEVGLYELQISSPTMDAVSISTSS